MKKHTKILYDFFDYGLDDFVPCEVCGARSQATHHIEARRMGGSKERDHIENLMSICRNCDDQFGDRSHFTEWLKEVHGEFMETRTPFVQAYGILILKKKIRDLEAQAKS